MRTPRWQLVTYGLIIVLGLLAALPNVLGPQSLSVLPDWYAKTRITLGLDLKGGSYLLLEVDDAALTRERLDALSRDAHVRLRDANVSGASTRVENGALLVTVPAAEHRAAALTALNDLARPSGFGLFKTPQPSLTITPSSDTEIRLVPTEAGHRDQLNAAVEQSLEIVRRRIDQVGVAEPTIQRSGAGRILVELPGLQDPNRFKELLGSTAKLTFHSVYPEGSHPPGSMVLPGSNGEGTYTVSVRPSLGGDHLTDAKAGFNPQTREPIVSFRFDSAGARTFGEITRTHVNQQFAIVLDKKVLSAPVIREPILGGSGEISGRFSVQEATDLAALLRAGALPAPLRVVEQRTVGPDLGSDAITMGAWTGLAGAVLVFAFMTLLYGSWGLVANLALALNVGLTFGTLSLVGATLTLPGIAGIVLGIGLAVDANILINERIREETQKGANAMSALSAGFRRAYATIVDSNVTTLIATTLLFLFGSGPVRGFAVTMGIGIAISMFTAVAVVRVVMTALVRRLHLKTLNIKPIGARLFPDGTTIPFMKARHFGIAFSAFLSLGSLVLFVTPGLNYGVDFKGGVQVEAALSRPADLPDLRGRLEKLNLGETGLQQFGSPTEIMIRAARQPGGDAEQLKAVEAIKGAVAEADSDAKIVRTEAVGPKVSEELATSGVTAVILASLAMFGYIWFRFEWPFAIGAIATLILDVTKTVGFFAITGMDFNLTAVAALLTLIGYSVNDKVVVYDRMRENMRLSRRSSLRELIDRSINETFARSTYTSVTAFLALVPMAIWGGPAVASFAVPMLFGIAVAAMSSVFIAAPILLFLGDWRTRHRPRVAAGTAAVAERG